MGSTGHGTQRSALWEGVGRPRQTTCQQWGSGKDGEPPNRFYLPQDHDTSDSDPCYPLKAGVRFFFF